MSEMDKMVIRLGAYIAVLEQSLTQLQEAHKQTNEHVLKIEAELAELKATKVDPSVGAGPAE